MKKEAIQIYKEETGKNWYYTHEQDNGVLSCKETDDYIEWLEEQVEFYYNESFI